LGSDSRGLNRRRDVAAVNCCSHSGHKLLAQATKTGKMVIRETINVNEIQPSNSIFFVMLH